MKKLAPICLTLLLFIIYQSNAQRIYSPQLQGYNGIGNVYYPNGIYQGQLSNGIAHGNGTFYYSDGTIFRGWFFNGWRNGAGILIVPYQGYLTSCWNMGTFVGPQCFNPEAGQTTYNTDFEVEEVVTESYNEFPEDADFIASNPDDYEIVQISSDTKLGRKLLGKYGGR